MHGSCHRHVSSDGFCQYFERKTEELTKGTKDID